MVHNGGLVNFLAPYERLRAANVGGTLEVLRLAGAGRPTALHLVSTLGVFLARTAPPRWCARPIPRTTRTGLGDGYNAAKWAADALARAARDRGLAVTVHRPARITGHALTGTGNADDYFTRLLRSFVGLGAVPELTDDPLDLAPVDHVAAGSAPEPFTAPTGGGTSTSTTTAHPSPSLAEALRTYGFPVRLRPIQPWRAALLNRPDCRWRPSPRSSGRRRRRVPSPRRLHDDRGGAGPGGPGLPPADARLIHTSGLVRAGRTSRPPAGTCSPSPNPEPR